MPTYKYQAVASNGVSIFGMFDAENQNALASYLHGRNMTLIYFTELSINSALNTEQKELPRMLQLRIGDRLREALLTDMPAHEAVRAIADEPFEHPVAMSMPWLFLMGLLASFVLLFLTVLIPEGREGLLLFAVSLPVCLATIWVCLHFWFVTRPRQMLLKIAARLERGDDGTFNGLGLLPTELRSVMNSSMDSQTRATSVAELIPMLSGAQIRSHQFAVTLLGPAIAMAVLVTGIHVLLLTIVPQFMEIFTSFGVEVPAPTMVVGALSRSAEFLGMSGLIVGMTTLAGVLIVVYATLVSPRTAEFWEPVPVLGLSVRWLMQARVARVLGVLIRNRATPAEAVQIATKASGFQSVTDSGQIISKMITSGTPELAYTRQLSGLPLALLFRVSERNDAEKNRQETAQAFESYAMALDQASTGNGSFVALVCELLIVISAGFLVGFVVIAMFMPLIKLLNNLAIIVPGGLI
jgi:type II secretory pathway component PulF